MPTNIIRTSKEEEFTIDYLKKRRRETFRFRQSIDDDWTEELWINKPYHYRPDGTKVYHSYADYCDD